MPITEWNGDAVVEKVMDAARRGVDDVTDACAQAAKREHWWKSRSGTLERSIFSRAARVAGGIAVGRWGVGNRAFYGIVLERKRPWLRPVADRLYPTLPRAINAHLN